jgi:TetR/AcrR family transcriptional regulator, transcriptional repressor for nem operon
LVATKGSLTRQNIIKHATQLFSVKGYYNTSMADILKVTGLSKGGLYGHFRSKEEIWYAVYDECVGIWKSIVFDGVKGTSDPLDRIERVVENSMRHYLGADLFAGGCFLINSLVELSGQSATMSDRVIEGFKNFSELLRLWLEEAEQKALLKDGLNLTAIAGFIVISLNGTAPLYASTRDSAIWKQTIAQLHFYIEHLRKEA